MQDSVIVLLFIFRRQDLPFRRIGRHVLVRHLIPLKDLVDIPVRKKGRPVRDLKELLMVVSDIEDRDSLFPDLL